MGWNRARASLEERRTLESERRGVRDIGGRLKAQMIEISARVGQMNQEFKLAREMWQSIEEPSEDAREEFERLKAEIRGLSDEIVKSMTNGDEEFEGIVAEINSTPKKNIDQLLALTIRMHQICKIKLDDDLPMCEGVATLRELAIKRLSDLAATELERASRKT